MRENPFKAKRIDAGTQRLSVANRTACGSYKGATFGNDEVTYVNRPHNAVSILCDAERCSSCMGIPATVTKTGQDMFFGHARLVIQRQRQHRGDYGPWVFDLSAHLRIAPPDHAQTLEEREQRALGHLPRVAGLPPGRESP